MAATMLSAKNRVRWHWSWPLKEFSVDRDEAVMIGDAAADVLAGKSAGVFNNWSALGKSRSCALFSRTQPGWSRPFRIWTASANALTGPPERAVRGCDGAFNAGLFVAVENGDDAVQVRVGSVQKSGGHRPF